MRGITQAYVNGCESLGCVANSSLVKVFMELDMGDACPAHMDLRQNYLGDRGCAALIRVLALLHWVSSVDLRGTGAADEAVGALCAVIPTHPQLHVVDLRDNNIYASGGKKLLHVLQRAPKRHHVYVDTDKLPPWLSARVGEAARGTCPKCPAPTCPKCPAPAVPVPAPSPPSAAEVERRGVLEAQDRLAELHRTCPPALAPPLGTLRLYYKTTYFAQYHRLGARVTALTADFGPEFLAGLDGLPDRRPNDAGYIERFVRAVRMAPAMRDEVVAACGELLGEHLDTLCDTFHVQVAAARVGHAGGADPARAASLYARIVEGVMGNQARHIPTLAASEARLGEISELVVSEDVTLRSLLLACVKARYLVQNHRDVFNAWDKAFYVDGGADRNGVERLREAVSQPLAELRWTLLSEVRQLLPPEIGVYLSELSFRVPYRATAEHAHSGPTRAAGPSIPRADCSDPILFLAAISGGDDVQQMLSRFGRWYRLRVFEGLAPRDPGAA